MNKYVLIPHDQYLSFKAFVAENRDTEGKQQSLDVNKSEKGQIINVKSENGLEPAPEKKENIVNSVNSEEKVSGNTQKSRESTQLSHISYPKASENIRHPLPLPGLPPEVD